MGMNHCLSFRLERERVLIDRAKALAAQSLISHLEVDVRGAEVLLCHRLLVLALGEVQLDARPLFKFLKLIKGLLVDFEHLLIHELILTNYFSHFSKVHQFELLLKQLLSGLLVVSFV